MLNRCMSKIPKIEFIHKTQILQPNFFSILSLNIRKRKLNFSAILLLMYHVGIRRINRIELNMHRNYVP